MDLFLIRHAPAVDRSEALADDARPLTEEGVGRVRDLVRALSRLDVELDLLLHSPLLRSMQTANGLASRVAGEIAATPFLTGEPGPPLYAALVGGKVGVVGHSPWLGQLAAALILGEPNLGDRFVFKKGGLAWLEGEPEPRRMVLRASLPPGVLRRM